jgi:hypothetical protein
VGRHVEFIGIDPGVGGGIAKITMDGIVRFACPTPNAHSEILQLLHREGDAPLFAALERVWSSPGWGHAGAFTFGVSYGALLMALTASRVPHINVIPRTWQKSFSISYPKGATATVKKNITKARAQELFPATRVTHAIADALLLAEYARRMFPVGVKPVVHVGSQGEPREQETLEGQEASGNQKTRQGEGGDAGPYSKIAPVIVSTMLLTCVSVSM